MKPEPRRNWIVVASAEHVGCGRAGGFIQAGHGKRAAVGRIHPGDRVVCYSPTRTFGGKDKLQTFTAFGVVAGGEPYQAEMGDGFQSFRRDVEWAKAKEAPIQPLLDTLELTAGQTNWGYRFRFGVLEVSDHDIALIAKAMGVKRPPT